MAVPPDVQQALDQLDADSVALDAAKQTASEANTALDAAQTTATESAQAVVAAASKQATDLATLQDLLNSTYGPGAARMMTAAAPTTTPARPVRR